MSAVAPLSTCTLTNDSMFDSTGVVPVRCYVVFIYCFSTQHLIY